MFTKNCQHCNKEFTHAWTGAKYCSKNCAYLSSRRKIEAICKKCGCAFYVKPSEINRNDGRGSYCSIECYNTARHAHLIRNCDYCGKEFSSRSDLMNLGKGRYCSRDCSNKSKRNSQTNKCLNCRNDYQVKPSVAEKSKFCSTTCHDEWRSENIRGEKHPLWRGGDNEYSLEWGRSFKKKIITRDNGICAICNKTGNVVHHIDCNKKNTTPKNCITLCRSCHSWYHGIGNGEWIVMKELSTLAIERTNG